MSELGSVSIDESGVITGTADYVKSFTQFSSNKEEQQGYFLALDCKPWDGRKFRVDRESGKGKEVAFNGDGVCIVFLGADVEKAKTAKFITVIDKEKTEQKLRIDLKFSEVK